MSKKINLLVSAIRTAAENLGKHPRDVTKGDVISTELFTEFELRKMPSLTALKAKHWPVTDKELADIKRLKTENSYTSKLEAQLGQFQINEEKIIAALKSIKLPRITPYKAKSKAKIERAINVLFSDLHIGSDILKDQTGHLNFGKVEEARRLARLTKEVIAYKPQYRAESKLNLCLLGDLIQNQLHDARDGAPTTEQIVRCIYLLSQSIAQFAQSFPEVNVYCNSGNHGRNQARHHGRAVNQKWDSHETVIAYALKMIFAQTKNIKFHIPKTPYVTYTVFGKKVFLTHGDTVLSPGYPGSAIKTGSLENQINKINSTLPDDEEYSVFAVGHVHVGSMTHLANGAVMITNGPMVPSDEYSVSIGLMENTCGQWLFESVKGFPVGDSRFIRVSSEDDQDKSLDVIIKPFENL